MDDPAGERLVTRLLVGVRLHRGGEQCGPFDHVRAQQRLGAYAEGGGSAESNDPLPAEDSPGSRPSVSDSQVASSPA